MMSVVSPNRHHRFQIEQLEDRRLMAASSALAPSTTVLPTASYDLTDSLTTATGVTKATLLDRLETTVRGEIKYQNSQGALIDPVA